MISYLWPLALLYCVSCSSVKQANFNPAQKISPAKLRSDFTLLQNILEENHPSLYWYTSKDSVDYYFKTINESLRDSLTELQFRNRTAWMLGKLRCGHTIVRSSKPYTQYFLSKRLPTFPLSLKVWQDSAVLVTNYNRDSVLKRGTIVTAINNRPTSTVLDSICQFISTDGYANNLKYQLLSFNFPAYYKNTFGLDSQYVISYVDSTGTATNKTVKNYDPKTDSSFRRTPLDPKGISRRQFKDFATWGNRNMLVDTALSTAILSVNTFSEGKLKKFVRKSFRKMKQQNIKNVVLDLRQNSGGNILLSTNLCQYLADKPFRVADTVAAFTRSFPYRKYIRPWFVYWVSMHLSGRRYADGRIHFRYFEKHRFKPKKKNHFDGDIYIVTGGYTFSAAALATSTLKGQQNVTVVGEETGGGAYGNSAMHLPTITLPHSGLRVTLPLYRLVLDEKRPKNGRGIFPDIEVRPSSTAIKRGVDSKLEKVKELITEKRKAANSIL